MDVCSVALNISECDEERRGGVGLEKECATECLWDEEGRAGTEEEGSADVTGRAGKNLLSL